MDSIKELLRHRYPPPAWAIFFEVANGTGAHHRRYADALAMSLFPSRGLDLHGFEIKEDRGDWLSELKNPEKAETIAKYCHYWWVVTGSPDVAKLEEVPKNWGLIVRDKGELCQAKKAVELTPKTVAYPFLAAILRRAHEEVEAERRSVKESFCRDKAYRKAWDEGRETGFKQGKVDVEMSAREHAALKREISKFEEKSGIKIDMWNGGRLGEAVKSILYLKERESAKQLEDIAADMDRISSDLKGKAAALRSAQAKEA